MENYTSIPDKDFKKTLLLLRNGYILLTWFVSLECPALDNVCLVAIIMVITGFLMPFWMFFLI